MWKLILNQLITLSIKESDKDVKILNRFKIFIYLLFYLRTIWYKETKKKSHMQFLNPTRGQMELERVYLYSNVKQCIY